MNLIFLCPISPCIGDLQTASVTKFFLHYKTLKCNLQTADTSLQSGHPTTTDSLPGFIGFRFMKVSLVHLSYTELLITQSRMMQLAILRLNTQYQAEDTCRPLTSIVVIAGARLSTTLPSNAAEYRTTDHNFKYDACL